MTLCRRLQTWVLCTLLVGGVVASVPQAAAQSQASSPAKSSSGLGNREVASTLHVKRLTAEKEFEERIRHIISGQLDTPFLLYVKLTLDEKQIQAKVSKMKRPVKLKTLPSGSENPALDFVRSLNTEDLYSYVANIVVALTLDKSVTADQEKVITTSIFGAAGLKQDRGDKVEVTRADMTSGSMKSKLETAQRATESARDQARKLENMLKEMEQKQKSDTTSGRIADDLKRIADDIRATREGLIELKASQEKSAKDLAAMEKADAKKTDPKFEGPLGGVKRLLEGLELPVTLFPLGLILAVVLWRLSSGAGKTGAALRIGLGELGKSVQAMAETLAAASKASATLAAQAAEAQQSQKGPSSASETQSGPGGGEGAMEMMQADALKTWTLMTERPYFTLAVLKDWVVEPEGQLRFLQVMEAIGAENATTVWRKIPPEELDLLGPLIDKAVPKASAFGAVSLLYRTVVREASLKPPVATEIPELEFLISLSDDKLANALQGADDATAGVVMLFLTPRRTVRIISALGERATSKLLAALEAAGRQKPELLKKTIATFKMSVEKSGLVEGSDSFLSYLVSMLESQKGGAAKVAQQFMNERSDLTAAVRKRVLTLDDVMTLDVDTLYDLFGNLAPTEVAALLTTLAPKQASVIAGFFKGKAKFQIDEELKKIQGKPKLARQANIQAARIRAGVLRKAKSLRDQGLIEFGVEPQGNGAREAKAS